MRNNSGRVYLKLVVIAVVLGGILTAFTLVRRNQFFASQAFMPANSGNINYKTEELDDGITKVVIYFATGDGQKTENISTVSLKMSLASGSEQKLTSVNMDGEGSETGIAGENLNEENKWKLPVNKVDEKGNALDFSFMATNFDKEGYTSSDLKPLVTLYVKGASSTDDLKVNFDKETSLLLSKKRPVTNIWNSQ